MKVHAPADIAKPGILEELSEFECKIRCHFQTPLNDVIFLHSDSFAPDGSKYPGRALAKCFANAIHPDFKNQYLNQYFLVGLTADTLQNIRTNLRKTYVAKKST
jgi:hypothetical protein